MPCHFDPVFPFPAFHASTVHFPFPTVCREIAGLTSSRKFGVIGAVVSTSSAAMARFDFAFFDSGARFDTPDARPYSHMITLTRFLDVPFDDEKISLAALLAFSTDHLQRMISNNPGGELNTRITATQSALDLVVNCVTDDTTKFGIRRARKLAKENFRETLPKAVNKIIAAVVAHYGPDAPEVLECCPSGRTIFRTSTDDQLANHLQTLVNAITAHVADLGAPLVAEATALKTGWAAIYAASEAATGAKTTTQEGKQLARENLQLMLFLNLLKLAEMFPRQPEHLPLYMQQSLLEPSPGTPPDDPPTPPPTPPGP